MSKKNGRRIGAGMKPRGANAGQPQQPVKAAEDPSTDEVQQAVVVEGTGEQSEGVAEGGNLAAESVQNLDSENPASVAPECGKPIIFIGTEEDVASLEALMRDSGRPAEELIQELNIESTEESGYKFGFTGFKDLKDVKFTEEGFVDPPQLREQGATIKAPQIADAHGIKGATVDVQERNPSIAELEKLLEARGEVRIEPDGTVRSYPIGERTDGSYGLVVGIREGMIEGIRQWAEADRKTPEEWLSDLIGEYLDTYGSPAGSK